jgi:hypothetical protein
MPNLRAKSASNESVGAGTALEYDEEWRNLNSELGRIESVTGNLLAPFAGLHDHHIATGFLCQAHDFTERFSFGHPETDSRFLRIQYNPERAARSGGAGIQSPPNRASIKHSGCFLCRDNIRWQQQGKQFGYHVEVDRNRYIAWMNPFPLFPSHIVMASEAHIGQEWSLHPDGRIEPGRIIADLVKLAARAPGYAGFYNGVGAGSSIEGHMHYHFIRPAESHGKFPLEVEAISAREEHPGQACWRLGNYPLEAMHWNGAPMEIIRQATRWLSEWAIHQRRLPQLTANILAISEEPGGAVSLFFVPRDRRRCQSACMTGLVGGLEVLGELVFSSKEDKELLDSGGLDYFSLEQVLAEVCTPLNMPKAYSVANPIGRATHTMTGKSAQLAEHSPELEYVA